MSAFDMDSGFDAVSGGVAAPKSSVVPEHGQGGDFDPFAAAAASAQPTVATAAPLSNAGAAAPVAAAPAGAAVASNTGAAVAGADEKAAPAGPTPYQLWEEKHQAQLAEKRQKEAEAKKAVVAAAKADIVKFMAARDERIAQRKIDNRAEEKASVAATKTAMSAGSSAMFEKIGRMVDLSAKANDKRPGVDRFRKLLINLKTQPPVHIAAGGAAGAGAGADLKLN